MSDELRRCNFVLPTSLYERVDAEAKRRNTTVVEMMRRFIRLGLIATELEKDPGSALIIREGDRDREIMLI